MSAGAAVVQITEHFSTAGRVGIRTLSRLTYDTVRARFTNVDQA